MEKEYSFSFIIPHKNCPDLLNRCLDSIPERDDVQIIVVDDNSDVDKKPSINRKDVVLVLLDAEHSKGAGRARNVGLQKAKGKWLLFADADDYYNDGFLDVLDNYINSKIDVLFFNYIYKDGISGKELPPHRFQKYFVEYDGSKLSKDQVRFHHNVPWTKMVSRSYLNIHHIIFEETVNGNDILFSIKVGYYTNNFMVEKQPLYAYIKNKEGITYRKLTIDDAFCQITHRIKLNNFYSYIGYPQWQNSVLKLIIHYIWLLGLAFLFKTIFNMGYFYSDRNEWVNNLNNASLTKDKRIDSRYNLSHNI